MKGVYFFDVPYVDRHHNYTNKMSEEIIGNTIAECDTCTNERVVRKYCGCKGTSVGKCRSCIQKCVEHANKYTGGKCPVCGQVYDLDGTAEDCVGKSAMSLWKIGVVTYYILHTLLGHNTVMMPIVMFTLGVFGSAVVFVTTNLSEQILLAIYRYRVGVLSMLDKIDTFCERYTRRVIVPMILWFAFIYCSEMMVFNGVIPEHYYWAVNLTQLIGLVYVIRM
jgi:hypothetical protein